MKIISRKACPEQSRRGAKRAKLGNKKLGVGRCELATWRENNPNSFHHGGHEVHEGRDLTTESTKGTEDFEHEFARAFINSHNKL